MVECRVDPWLLFSARLSVLDVSVISEEVNGEFL